MRVALGLVMMALIGAGIYVGLNYQAETHFENGHIAYVKLTPRGSAPGRGGGGRHGVTIRRPGRCNPRSASPRSTWTAWMKTSWRCSASATCSAGCLRDSN